MVRAQLDPPSIPMARIVGGLAQLGEHLLCKQGVVGSIPSSSTKSGALKVLQSLALHNTKAVSAETAFVLIAKRSIGCSLKIHRVEISVAGGKQETAPCHQQLFDCVKTNKTLRKQVYSVMTNHFLIAISRNYSHYGITREVRDLTSFLKQRRYLARDIKVIGSSD